MPPRKRSSTGDEVVEARSASEFFAENQNIAGFDNPGKSLFTTIREFVENALDAAEAVRVLPDIAVTVDELTAREFAEIRECFADDGGASVKLPAVRATPSKRGREEDAEEDAADEPAPVPTSAQQLYYRVTCRDNGCGMAHESIPGMLGRVLSGSKYRVRQTRGKFGLGAKMALIWAKKSTGLPLRVVTAHAASELTTPQDTAAVTAIRTVPARRSLCVLDMDIYSNEPAVIRHESRVNAEGWVGTEIMVVISGAWAAYRRFVVRYMQQLAVITPYANLALKFRSAESDSRSFDYCWVRRSLSMPPPAAEVHHHPASVNDLVVRKLIDQCLGHEAAGRSRADDDDDDDDQDDDVDDDNDDEDFGASSRRASKPRKRATPRARGGGTPETLVELLTRRFSCISHKAALAVIGALPPALRLEPTTSLSGLDAKAVHALTTALHAAHFPAPSGTCLAPVGEYNLRLGILKVSQLLN